MPHFLFAMYAYAIKYRKTKSPTPDEPYRQRILPQENRLAKVCRASGRKDPGREKKKEHRNREVGEFVKNEAITFGY